MGQVSLHPHCIVAIEQAVILSGDRTSRWANSPLVYLHGKVLTGSGIRDWSCGTLRWSVVSSGNGRYLLFSTLVEQVIPSWVVLLRHVLLKVGLLMGDAPLEALKVLAMKVHLLLYPSLIESGGLAVGHYEVIELLANSVTVRHEVVQPVLSIVPIVVEATPNYLPKCEVMRDGDKEGL